MQRSLHLFRPLLSMVVVYFTIFASETICQDASAVKPVSFLQIDRTHFSAISGYLVNKNDTLPSGLILAMGIEPDTLDTLNKTLAIISLTSDNLPVKHVFKIDEAFFSTLKQQDAAKDTTVKTSDSTITVGVIQKVSLTSKTTARNRSQDGRLYFMINTTARSLWVYPVGYGTYTEDFRTSSGLSLLTVGGALYGSYLFSKSIELGYGRVEFMNFGADMGGIWYPTLLRIFLQNNLPANYTESDSKAINKTASTIAMLAYPLGIFAGSRFNFAGNYEYGNASVMSNLARVAPLYGFMLPLIFTNGPDDDYMNIASISSMALIPAGFALGKHIVGNRSISSGRSILMTSCGIFGALSGMMIPTLFTNDDVDIKALAVSTLLGHAGGMAFGHFYKAPVAYSYSQGIFTAVSGIVGTGIGVALPLLGSVDTHEPYVLCGMAGCWSGVVLGEILSKSLFEEGSHDRRASPEITFPGLATLPFLLLSSHMKSGTTSLPGITTLSQSHATLVDIRF